MGALFNRQFSLTIGSSEIATSVLDPSRIHSTLRIAFDVKRNLQAEPNSAEIAIWNLSPESRAFFVEVAKLPAVLKVGYSGSIFQVFSGDIIYAATQRKNEKGEQIRAKGETRERVDWITRLLAKDGGNKYSSARINEALAPGTSLQVAIQKVADKMGIPPGNLLQKIRAGNKRGNKNEFATGMVLSGLASHQLEKLMVMAGYEWSIQDGKIQALLPDESLPTIVKLKYDSGLIGSPEIGKDGVVKVRALLQPDLLPGNAIEVESKIGSKPISGKFKIETARYVGDSWGNDWHADLEMKVL